MKTFLVLVAARGTQSHCGRSLLFMRMPLASHNRPRGSPARIGRTMPKLGSPSNDGQEENHQTDIQTALDLGVASSLAATGGTAILKDGVLNCT